MRRLRFQKFLVVHGRDDQRVIPAHSAQIVDAFLHFNDLLDDGLMNESRKVSAEFENRMVPNGHRYMVNRIFFHGLPVQAIVRVSFNCQAA